MEVHQSDSLCHQNSGSEAKSHNCGEGQEKREPEKNGGTTCSDCLKYLSKLWFFPRTRQNGRTKDMTMWFYVHSWNRQVLLSHFHLFLLFHVSPAGSSPDDLYDLQAFLNFCTVIWYLAVNIPPAASSFYNIIKISLSAAKFFPNSTWLCLWNLLNCSGKTNPSELLTYYVTHC